MRNTAWGDPVDGLIGVHKQYKLVGLVWYRVVHFHIRGTEVGVACPVLLLLLFPHLHALGLPRAFQRLGGVMWLSERMNLFVEKGIHYRSETKKHVYVANNNVSYSKSPSQP